MRDPIREKDIEQATGAAQVEVDVADNGIAVVTLKRDDLDALLGAHQYRNGYTDGFDEGLSVGRREARAEAAAKALQAKPGAA